MSRSTIRSYKPRAYDTAKDAATALVEAAGGLVPASELVRVGRSRLAEYTDPGLHEVHMPVDVALSLEASTGSHAMAELFARKAGGVLLTLPRDTSPAELAQGLAQFGKETGDVFAKGVTVMENGKLDESERPEFLKEIDQAMRCLAALRAYVQGEAP